MKVLSKTKSKPRQYVYVVHGFGNVEVFSTREAARKHRDLHGLYCDVTRAVVRKRVRP
jgi:hypothetical protein